MAKNEEAVKNDMFGFGDKNVAFAKYFSGTSYLKGIFRADDNVDVNIAITKGTAEWLEPVSDEEYNQLSD